MGQTLVATVMTIAALGSPTAAGVHKPEIENRLAFIVGDWTIAGSERDYRDDCRWFDNRSFVVCDTHDGRHGAAHRSIAVLGWSPAPGNFTYLQYDDGGRSRTEVCFANEHAGLTCLGERRGSDGLTQTRSYIGPVPGGLVLRQDKSVNAGAWTHVGQVMYVPRQAR